MASVVNAFPLKILIVDDEISIRRTMTLCLQSDGHEVHGTSNAVDAMHEVQRRRYDLLFLDLRLEDVSGIDLLPALFNEAPWLSIVVMTAYASVETAVECMKAGAVDYLQKPFDATLLRLHTRRIAAMIELQRKLEMLDPPTSEWSAGSEIRTASATMQRVLDTAQTVAQTDATVLITGESGTGKSLLAQAIHRWSARAAHPLVTVSCPSIPSELLESELFGHRRGAFTGAVDNAPGRLALAESGTLFLDEIADLPRNLQPKLLRLLQDHEYESIGDPHTRNANVRIVAATNHDLPSAIAEGRFREDLYFRLNVVEIHMPALRERREDIRDIAERCVHEFAYKHRKRVQGTDESFFDILAKHRWPGNVRELRNAVERAVILCAGPLVRGSDLALQEGGMSVDVQPGDAISLAQLEELHIRRILASTSSIQEAAAILGIDQATLWRRRKLYGI
jgi:NtrC-family two-component system response regulator AlgB